MPHGIEVDSKGNIWLTDVALHQVGPALHWERNNHPSLNRKKLAHTKNPPHSPLPKKKNTCKKKKKKKKNPFHPHKVDFVLD